jgi:methylphosphotriester-DNA--protein-cysteine methyltransferase
VAELDPARATARDALVSLLRDDEISVERAARACELVLDAFGPAPPPAPMDARVRRALALLDASPEEPPSLTELAAEVGVSATRLRHLFKAQVGVPVSRYALWMRLRTAIVRAMSGASMTEAAYAAGFADAAHFTRTCKQMFGLPPSTFAPVEAFFAAP